MDTNKLKALGKSIGQIIDNTNLRIEGEVLNWNHTIMLYSTPTSVVLEVEDSGLTIEVPHIGAVRKALKDLPAKYTVAFLDSGDWALDLNSYQGDMALKVSRTSDPGTSVIFYNWGQLCDALSAGSLEEYLLRAFND
jgi:hypothetical protein